MKVLYITPNGVNNTSPQIELAKYMENRFKRLDLFVPGLTKPPTSTDYDVVFSAMEATAEIGLQYAQHLDVPYYSHWEWIPPFRIWGFPGGQDPRKWGYRLEHLKGLHKNQGFKSKYLKILQASEKATINSCASSSFLNIAEQFMGKKINNNFVKFPTACFNLKKKKYDKEDYFITVSRLVPNKRVVDLAHAVSRAKIDIPWIIVGSGAEKTEIERVMSKSKNKVVFLGAINGEKKLDLMGKARFQLSAWHGLPQLEAAYCGTPTINLKIPATEELYGNTLVWAKDVNVMAERISQAKSFNYYSEYSDRVISNLSNININTKESGANIIEEKLRSIV